MKAIPEPIQKTVQATTGLGIKITQDILQNVFDYSPSETAIRRIQMDARKKRYGTKKRFIQITDYMDYRDRTMRSILRKMIPVFIRDGREFRIQCNSDKNSIAIFLKKL